MTKLIVAFCNFANAAKEKDKADGWGFPGFNSRESGTVASPTHRPPFSPRKYSSYSILLEAESTSACSAVPQPTAPPRPTPTPPPHARTYTFICNCLPYIIIM